MATKENASFSDPEEAIRLAQQACELTDFNQPEFLGVLSVAYAAAGRFDKAIETAQKALELAQAANQQQMANELRAYLELYKNGHAYRDSGEL